MQREKEYQTKTVAEIVREICSIPDLFYMSGRKNTSVRGGMIGTNNKELFDKIRPWLPVYEGFYTYGGMSMREIGAMTLASERWLILQSQVARSSRSNTLSTGLLKPEFP